MDLAELARLTSEFVEAVDELNDAARRAGQTEPGAPLRLGSGSGPLRRNAARVLDLQQEIVALISPVDGQPVPAPRSVAIGLVVPAREWHASPESRARHRARARAALDRAAARQGVTVVGEPEESVVDDGGWMGVVVTLTAPADQA